MKRETLERAAQIIKSIEICGNDTAGCEGCLYYNESSQDCMGSRYALDRLAVGILAKIIQEEKHNGQKNT